MKEEVYAREALALGLDKDDAVIRRRLRQKMEFLSDAEIEALDPTDAELEEYLKSNLAQVRHRSRNCISVRSTSTRSGAEIRSIKMPQHILETLRSNPSLDPASLGDITLLPSAIELTIKPSIGQTFGREFAEAVSQAKPGQWIGPIKSGYGLHLVRVSQMSPGRVPDLGRSAERRGARVEQRQAQGASGPAFFTSLEALRSQRLRASRKLPAQAAASP